MGDIPVGTHEGAIEEKEEGEEESCDSSIGGGGIIG